LKAKILWRCLQSCNYCWTNNKVCAL